MNEKKVWLPKPEASKSNEDNLEDIYDSYFKLLAEATGREVSYGKPDEDAEIMSKEELLNRLKKEVADLNKNK